jgi:oxidase EvaA
VSNDRRILLGALARSLVSCDRVLCSTPEVRAWIDESTRNTYVRIERVPLSSMSGWFLNPDSGNIVHRSGGFFTIDGLRVVAGASEIRRWDQPIINQSEIGFLGCIVRVIDGVAYFLVQAKIEPGNINVVQLSPTLQATRSNYTRAHGGRAPHYLREFLDPSKLVVTDQLQSEQGSRFLRKRNRNIIIEADVEVVNDRQFRWLTLGQIKELCKTDNLINMDLRTVISSVPIDEMLDIPECESILRSGAGTGLGVGFSSSGDDSYGLADCVRSALSWLAELKSRTDLHVQIVPLATLQGWDFSEQGFVDRERRRFDIDWVSVEIDGRVVNAWDQPIVRPHGRSLFAFLLRNIDGTVHFLVQATLECGNHDILEIGPTVQCTEYEATGRMGTVPFLDDVLSAKGDAIIFDALQSEEGGRFYHDENRYMVVMVNNNATTELPPNYRWMTFRQLMYLMKFNNHLNIQARVLLGALPIV